MRLGFGVCKNEKKDIETVGAGWSSILPKEGGRGTAAQRVHGPRAGLASGQGKAKRARMSFLAPNAVVRIWRQTSPPHLAPNADVHIWRQASPPHLAP